MKGNIWLKNSLKKVIPVKGINFQIFKKWNKKSERVLGLGFTNGKYQTF